MALHSSPSRYLGYLNTPEKPAKIQLGPFLRAQVKTNPAGYKATRKVMFVDGFKMTSSGKINRRALHEADQS